MRINKSLLFISIITLLITSCSHNSETKLTYSDVDTIKNVIKDMELDVTWTKEVEGTRLTDPLTSTDKISKDVALSVNSFNILPATSDPIYPSIENFGSLNTSTMTDNIRNTVSQFCEAISKNIYSGAEGTVQSNYQFNLYFFRKELIDNWPEKFNTPFPVTKEDFNVKSKVSENPDEESAEPELPDPIFENWIYGEPFIGETLAEIPVRFFSSNGTIDVTIYMNSKSENSIFQITIDRWEKGNGEE